MFGKTRDLCLRCQSQASSNSGTPHVQFSSLVLAPQKKGPSEPKAPKEPSVNSPFSLEVQRKLFKTSSPSHSTQEAILTTALTAAHSTALERGSDGQNAAQRLMHSPDLRLGGLHERTVLPLPGITDEKVTPVAGATELVARERESRMLVGSKAGGIGGAAEELDDGVEDEVGDVGLLAQDLKRPPVGHVDGHVREGDQAQHVAEARVLGDVEDVGFLLHREARVG